ncbi:hypothetical protein MOC12_20920 [Bacillus spizizenii]|nr:hypothetical protein [Bacillus spizizenii]
MAELKNDYMKERTLVIELSQKEVDTIRVALLDSVNDSVAVALGVKILNSNEVTALQDFFRKASERPEELI